MRATELNSLARGIRSLEVRIGALVEREVVGCLLSQLNRYRRSIGNGIQAVSARFSADTAICCGNARNLVSLIRRKRKLKGFPVPN